MNRSRLRWLAIALPLGALALLDYLRHRVFYPELHDFPGVILLWALLVGGVTAFSFVVFGLIGDLERRVLDQNAQLSALNEIAAASAENPELSELLSGALDKILLTMRADAGIICLLDPETDELVAACHRGLSDELAQQVHRHPVDAEPIAARVVRTGCPVTIERLLDDPQTADMARKEGFRSAVSVPLKAEGEVGGVLGLATRRERRFTSTELELLRGIGGQLGLAVRNALLFARTQQRNIELASLLDVGRASASSLDLPAMLEEALDAVLAVTSAETAEVWLVSDGHELSLERVRGAAAEAFREGTRLRNGDDLPGLAVRSGALVSVHDLASDSRFARDQVVDVGFKTYCALPLHRGVETVGVLAVASRDRESLCSNAELKLLQGIGELLAVAIENGRLHARVLDTVVLEERERISRELHDSLGQILGYINTQAIAIRRFLASGKANDAQREVLAVEETARGLYADVREAILGLRTSPGSEGGLVPTLHAYLERYREMSGIEARLETSEAIEACKVPPSAEIQILRIVQEALANVRKHARAGRATVSFDAAGEDLVITVSDDGRGFDPGALVRTGWPRFGLQTMRERAGAIGGRLSITSALRDGTQVTLTVPARRAMEVASARRAR